MTVSGEKLNLLIMRDSGETKRFRVRRSWFYFFICILFCMPIFAGLICWGAFYLWEENLLVKQKLFAAEKLNHEYAATVKRLSTFESLMKYEAEMDAMIAQNAAKTANIPAKTTSTPNAIEAENKESTEESSQTPDKEIDQTQVTQVQPTQENIEEPARPETQSPEESANLAAMQDGPGHEDFPVVDEGVVLVENVQSRLIEPRRIRTALDLRNPGSTSLAGTVFCILSLASGEMVPLTLSPADVGSYRILRWKKAVLFADIASEHDLFNAQMIIEVKDTTGKLIYRNSYAIEQ